MSASQEKMPADFVALCKAVDALLDDDEVYIAHSRDTDPNDVNDFNLFLVSADHEPLHDKPLNAEGILELARKWRAVVDRDPPSLINGASHTKLRGRGRPPDPAVARRRGRLITLSYENRPATVRQLYYLAETEGLVPKTENGYAQVQRDIGLLRQLGRIGWDWIADHTRWQRKSRSYLGIEHFLQSTISAYRRNLWHDADRYVEVWCEKDALAGVIIEETDPYDVPLMVSRGFSSLTYLYEAAEAINEKRKPAYIYALYDRDPSGDLGAATVERALRDYAPHCDIYFKQIAVTAQQIAERNLPTRETKQEGNKHAKNFVGDSCELDAIPPLQLRALVRQHIEQHIDADQLATIKVAEESEREALKLFARNWRRP